MSNDLKRYSFLDLLKLGRIRIPKIQRDYAQGRPGKKIEEIRRAFVHTLLLVVKGKSPVAELDFIYGSNQDNAFEPLDGQQRLTTLFLLHWMVGIKLCSTNDEKSSLFIYETRNTSKEFCDELVQHDAIQLGKEASSKGIKLSTLIKERDWFKWEWRYDPTVLSMLIVIDAIFEEMDSSLDMSVCQKNINSITFNMLNLEDFGLSNELFIKMNARGKQLSEFDKLKSTLEEELQIQQEEKSEDDIALALASTEEEWRNKIDGKWIDLFWNKYARIIVEQAQTLSIEEQKSTCLYAAKKVENQFRKLILRLIAIQLFESENADSKIREASYSLDDGKIDNLLVIYADSLIDLRSYEEKRIPTTRITINFPQLINDIDILIYKDKDNRFQEITSLLPLQSHIKSDNQSLFELFLSDKVPNDIELIFYSMILFLRCFRGKITDTNDTQPNDVFLSNLTDWVHILRNILLNDNNTQRIDKIGLSWEATKSLKKMIDDLFYFSNENNLCIEKDYNVVKKFFTSSSETYIRIDNQSLAEERLKVTLAISNKEWDEYIKSAETHPYLWGQIRCLLDWSNEDIGAFVLYSEKLHQLLDFIGNNNLIYYTSILAFSPECWKESNRLYEYNKDRDNSFKRYLRDRQGQTYGTVIKSLIDCWIKDYPTSSVQDFLYEIRETRKTISPPWVQCIINDPSILAESWNRRIYSQRGHVILAQRKTMDSHCFDPILVYFRNMCRRLHLPESDFKLYDSKGDYEHAFDFNTNAEKIHIEWSKNDGNYIVANGLSSTMELNSSSLIDYFDNVIQRTSPLPKT